MGKTDWKNLESVKALARKFGTGMLVVKHDDRPNYNITHAARRDLWDKPTVKVLYKT